MPRKKNNPDKFEALKQLVIADIKERGAWREVDEHLVDEYIGLVRVADQCRETIEKRGIFYEDERGVERTNPAIRTLNSTESSLNAMAKTLGIGPYSRKLTTGTDQKKDKPQTGAAMLRPLKRTKAN